MNNIKQEEIGSKIEETLLKYGPELNNKSVSLRVILEDFASSLVVDKQTTSTE